MPLRAKINESKLPKMTAQTNGAQVNGAKPKTGIKVIIVGAGTLPNLQLDFSLPKAPTANFVSQASAASQQP